MADGWALIWILRVPHLSRGMTGGAFCFRTLAIDGASYTLDSAGNRTAEVDQLAAVTSNYTYDAIYQLTQATQGGSTTESYTYDPVSNRTASLGVSSYTTNASNQMTANSNALTAEIKIRIYFHCHFPRDHSFRFSRTNQPLTTGNGADN